MKKTRNNSQADPSTAANKSTANRNRECGTCGSADYKNMKISVDKLHTHGNILCQDSCSYHKLSSPGIKVPCREPWENKSFKRRNASWQPRRKPPRKRNTKRTMLVQKSPEPPGRSTSREAFPFRFCTQLCSCEEEIVVWPWCCHPNYQNLSSDWERAWNRHSRQPRGRRRNRGRTCRPD